MAVRGTTSPLHTYPLKTNLSDARQTLRRVAEQCFRPAQRPVKLTTRQTTSIGWGSALPFTRTHRAAEKARPVRLEPWIARLQTEKRIDLLFKRQARATGVPHQPLMRQEVPLMDGNLPLATHDRRGTQHTGSIPK